MHMSPILRMTASSLVSSARRSDIRRMRARIAPLVERRIVPLCARIATRDHTRKRIAVRSVTISRAAHLRPVLLHHRRVTPQVRPLRRSLFSCTLVLRSSRSMLRLLDYPDHRSLTRCSTPVQDATSSVLTALCATSVRACIGLRWRVVTSSPRRPAAR